MKIYTIIVDDEPLARERIRTLLGTENDIHIAAECGNGKEALRLISEQKIDLVFLDIQMPELDGIRLLEKLPEGKTPFVIFTTAYDSFAVKAFELNALDYLLKPFTKKRFLESLSRVRQKFGSEDKDLFFSQMLNTLRSVVDHQQFPEKIVVKADGKVRFIPTAEIRWIESEANYLRIHTAAVSPLIRETMTNFFKKLDPSIFLRLHRTVIVNTTQIKELQPWLSDELIALLHDGTKLPIGRTYRKTVNEFFGL
ncbi:MAG: response regulator transcription factor [Bacteriovoracaceae bacterium]|nr:response regulator transcription factor [Bacteroidota bacterium]